MSQRDILCTACRIGKGKFLTIDKSCILSKDTTIQPGDVVQMSQFELSMAGRVVTYSGKTSKIKCYSVTIYLRKYLLVFRKL